MARGGTGCVQHRGRELYGNDATAASAWIRWRGRSTLSWGLKFHDLKSTPRPQTSNLSFLSKIFSKMIIVSPPEYTNIQCSYHNIALGDRKWCFPYAHENNSWLNVCTVWGFTQSRIFLRQQQNNLTESNLYFILARPPSLHSIVKTHLLICLSEAV